MGFTKMSDVPIDESVGLLDFLNHSELDSFRSNNPNFKHILELGEIGGEVDVEDSELMVRAKLAKTVLTEVLHQTKERYLPQLSRKIKKLKRLELMSQIVIMISSSTIMALLLTESESKGVKYGSYVAAALSLISAILTLILKKNSGEWNFNKENQANVYETLVTKRIEAEEILQEIDLIISLKNKTLEEVSPIFKQGNELAKELKMIISKISVS